MSCMLFSKDIVGCCSAGDLWMLQRKMEIWRWSWGLEILSCCRLGWRIVVGIQSPSGPLNTLLSYCACLFCARNMLLLLLSLAMAALQEASTDPKSTGLESSPDYEYVGLYPKVPSFLLPYLILPLVTSSRAVHTMTTTFAKPTSRKRGRKLRTPELSRSQKWTLSLVLGDRWSRVGERLRRGSERVAGEESIFDSDFSKTWRTMEGGPF
jgi:hypothetical protein